MKVYVVEVDSFDGRWLPVGQFYWVKRHARRDAVYRALKERCRVATYSRVEPAPRKKKVRKHAV